MLLEGDFLISTCINWARCKKKKKKKSEVMKVLEKKSLLPSSEASTPYFQCTHKRWQVVNQSTVNAIFYQIIKRACRHLIFPRSCLNRGVERLEKLSVFTEVAGRTKECV